MEEAKVKQIKSEILGLDHRNKYWFLKLPVILNGHSQLRHWSRMKKTHWENDTDEPPKTKH